MEEPKILVVDIETAPNLGYVWAKYQQDVYEYKSEWYILCFVAKWLGQKKTIASKLPDFKMFKKDPQNDFFVVKELWKLFDEADVVITHNGNKFDIKKSNARFLYHKMSPPSPFKSIDTRAVAKKYFNFNSNKLDDLGRYLNLGRKVEHEGFSLWLKCMDGDKPAWNRMINYNKQDVILLEKLYYTFQGWITNHPNIGLFRNQDYVCPNCGSKHLHKRGYAYTKVNKYQRVQCVECGAWSQHRRAEKTETGPQIKN